MFLKHFPIPTGGNACHFSVINNVCLSAVTSLFLGLSPPGGQKGSAVSFTYFFLHFFNFFYWASPLMSLFQSNMEDWSPDLPICFSCFSASFSLLSALMLSAWYIWYVFITQKMWPKLLKDVCLKWGNGNHYMTCMLKISPSNWQRESQIVSKIDNGYPIPFT